MRYTYRVTDAGADAFLKTRAHGQITFTRRADAIAYAKRRKAETRRTHSVSRRHRDHQPWQHVKSY